MIGLDFKDVNHVFHIHKLHATLQKVLTFLLHETHKAWPETTWVVTSVYREDGGVHNYYRGIDLVPQDRDTKKMEIARESINNHFDYGKGKLEVCPPIRHGTAKHCHLQVCDATIRKSEDAV